MHVPRLLLALLSLFVLPFGNTLAQVPAPPAFAGWYGIFPELTGYDRSFQAPVVAADGKSPPYLQTVRYEWGGGRIEAIEVTLARDPAFKQKYAADAFKKDEAAKEVKVGKHSGRLWSAADGTPRRLVVPLAADKILELRGTGQVQDLVKLAEAWDLAAAEAALEAAPRTEFGRKLEAFRALKPGTTFAQVTAWLGPADQAEKDGAAQVFLYKLPDNSRVRLVFDADLKSLMYAKREGGKDPKGEDLLSK